MARNAIKRYYRTSNMAAGGHFVKNVKKYKDPYIKIRMDEMARNAIEREFRKSKMDAGSHFVKKNIIPYWSKMARNVIET